MTTEKPREFDLIEKFIAQEILTGVDGGLRRAVTALHSAYAKVCEERDELEQACFDWQDKFDSLAKNPNQEFEDLFSKYGILASEVKAIERERNALKRGLDSSMRACEKREQERDALRAKLEIAIEALELFASAGPVSASKAKAALEKLK